MPCDKVVLRFTLHEEVRRESDEKGDDNTDTNSNGES
jgi:hypothetical protein